MSAPVNVRWTSRKLIVAISAAFIATALLIAKQIPPDIWSQVFMATIGVYLLSQGIPDAVKELKRRIDKPA